MSIASAIKSFFITPKAQKSLSGAAASWLRGEEPGRGGADLVNAMQQSVWVYACVSLLAQNVGNTAFRFTQSAGQQGRMRPRRRKNGAEALIDAGLLVELFDQPHPLLNRYDFWELLVSWLQLRGRAFVVALTEQDEVVRIRGRLPRDPAPDRLMVLPSDRVTRILSQGQNLGWRYFASYADPLHSINFLPEELLFLRLPHPWDMWDGLAPLQAAWIAAQTDYAAGKVMQGIMLNNADSGVTVTTDQLLNEEQRLQVLAALRERKRQAGTADKPLVLEGGLKIEKPALTAADLQMLENRKWSRQEICCAFRTPQELLGYTEDANRSVGDAARLNYTENTLAPFCIRLAAGLQPIIDCFGDGIEGWFDVDDLPIMQGARRARVDVAIKLFGLGYPANEINQTLDLGLPDLAWGDRGYLPFALQEVGQGDQAAEPKELPLAPGEEEPGEPGNEMAALRRLFTKASEGNEGDAAHQCVTPSGYLTSIRGSVKLKQGKLKRFFWEQRGRVLRWLEKHFKDAPVTEQRGLGQILDEGAEDEELLRRLKPALISDLEFGGAQLWRELHLPDEFRVSPELTLKYLSQREQKIKDINATTFERLKASLGEGMQAGEAFSDLADRVKEVFVASDTRAETIALTETNTAVNSGRFYGMQEVGVERKAWLASNLANSRSWHQQAGRDYADGIPITEPFFVGGEKLMYPGDPEGSPENTINCKCTTIALVGGKAINPVKFLHYEEWLHARQTHRDSPDHINPPPTL